MGLFEGPWKQVEFGHVSIDFNVPKSTGLNMVADGMNTAGLTLSTNLFRDMQLAPAKSDNNSIFYGNFGRWALGSFNSTNAMIQALKNITMTDFGGLSSDLALHWAVSDKSGHSVVIEYDGKNGPGKPHILENSVRVLTNDPSYQWQVKNIDTYSFLGPDPDKNRNKQIQKDTGFDKPFDIVPGVCAAQCASREHVLCIDALPGLTEFCLHPTRRGRRQLPDRVHAMGCPQSTAYG